MSKEILTVGDWIQYVAINGQSQHGKVDDLVRDMNKKELRVDLELLNGQKDSIWINDEWIKSNSNIARLLDEKYNERNKQSNDIQQRKRGELNINIGMEIEPNDTVNHPSHYNYGEIEVIDFIEQVTQHYNA